jgi:hypothetical protein
MISPGHVPQTRHRARSDTFEKIILFSKLIKKVYYQRKFALIGLGGIEPMSQNLPRVILKLVSQL